ncbi:MAG: hypothetical protein ACXWSD_14790, partial [Bdellovibrionota bacterium]
CGRIFSGGEIGLTRISIVKIIYAATCLFSRRGIAAEHRLERGEVTGSFGFLLSKNSPTLSTIEITQNSQK